MRSPSVTSIVLKTKVWVMNFRQTFLGNQCVWKGRRSADVLSSHRPDCEDGVGKGSQQSL